MNNINLINIECLGVEKHLILNAYAYVCVNKYTFRKGNKVEMIMSCSQYSFLNLPIIYIAFPK